MPAQPARIVATKAAEPVLLGSAILGAVAGGAFGDIGEAMSSLSSVDQMFAPATGDIPALHGARYRGFKNLQVLSRELRNY